MLLHYVPSICRTMHVPINIDNHERNTPIHIQICIGRSNSILNSIQLYKQGYTISLVVHSYNCKHYMLAAGIVNDMQVV